MKKSRLFLENCNPNGDFINDFTRVDVGKPPVDDDPITIIVI